MADQAGADVDAVVGSDEGHEDIRPASGPAPNIKQADPWDQIEDWKELMLLGFVAPLGELRMLVLVDYGAKGTEMLNPPGAFFKKLYDLRVVDPGVNSRSNVRFDSVALKEATTSSSVQSEEFTVL